MVERNNFYFVNDGRMEKYRYYMYLYLFAGNIYRDNASIIITISDVSRATGMRLFELLSKSRWIAVTRRQGGTESASKWSNDNNYHHLSCASRSSRRIIVILWFSNVFNFRMTGLATAGDGDRNEWKTRGLRRNSWTLRQVVGGEPEWTTDVTFWFWSRRFCRPAVCAWNVSDIEIDVDKPATGKGFKPFWTRVWKRFRDIIYDA